LCPLAPCSAPHRGMGQFLLGLSLGPSDRTAATASPSCSSPISLVGLFARARPFAFAFFSHYSLRARPLLLLTFLLWSIFQGARGHHSRCVGLCARTPCLPFARKQASARESKVGRPASFPRSSFFRVEVREFSYYLIQRSEPNGGRSMGRKQQLCGE